MRIIVKAKARAKENKIVPPAQKLFKNNNENEYFSISVKEPPEKGRANDAIKKIIADYFHINYKNVVLLGGFSTKMKIFEINGL